MAEYRWQIPSELLDAGFPVEWIVITDEGSVYVHYANPVMLETLSLDDRRIIEDPGPMLRVTIGTGQTVEMAMRRTSGALDLVERCPNCKQPMPDPITHPWTEHRPSPWPGDMSCDECQLMTNRRVTIAARNRAEHPAKPPWWREDGYCPACGQKPERMRLLEQAMSKIKKAPASEKNNKLQRELARMLRRADKGKTNG